jgi:Zn-finger nucleic acid-binding protein
MAQCPYCGKSFNSEKGVSVHLHSCSKCSGFDMYVRGQGKQRRNESDNIFKTH